jgi:hypothetical protein
LVLQLTFPPGGLGLAAVSVTVATQLVEPGMINGTGAATLQLTFIEVEFRPLIAGPGVGVGVGGMVAVGVAVGVGVRVGVDVDVGDAPGVDVGDAPGVGVASGWNADGVGARSGLRLPK